MNDLNINWITCTWFMSDVLSTMANVAFWFPMSLSTRVFGNVDSKDCLAIISYSVSNASTRRCGGENSVKSHVRFCRNVIAILNSFQTVTPVQRFWSFSFISAAVCPIPIQNSDWSNCSNNSKDHLLSLNELILFHWRV